MSDEINFEGIEDIEDQNPSGAENIAGPSSENSLTQEQLDEINKEVDLQKKYGDNSVEAALLGAARGLSFGLADQAFVKTGIYTPEELSELKKRNEIASLLGEVGSVAATFIPTGGTSGAANIVGRSAKIAGKGIEAVSKGASAVEKVAEKAFISALSKDGKNSIAREIVKRSAPKVIGSSVEGIAYETGQLISEDALGNVELNAENIIAAAGTGALLGGVAGGAFEIPKALVPVGKSIGSKASKGISKKVNQITDAKEAAFDLYGITPTQRAKLKNNAATFTEELPEWTVKKAKLGYFTDSEKLKNNIVKIRQEAGERIGNTMQKIDDVADVNPGIMPSAQETYINVAKKIDEEVIEKFKGIPGFKAQLSPVKQIRNEFIDLAKQGGQLKASTIHSMRMKIDDLIKFDKAPGTYTLKEKALNDIRHSLNDEISKIAEKASTLDTNNQFGNLLKELLDANKDFSYASRLLPNIEKKVEKQAAKRSIFNISDLVLGGVSYEVLGGLGGLGLGAKKLLESDFRRRVSVLSSIERQNKNVANKISSGIDNFFKNIKAPARTTTAKALTSSSLSLGENNKKPKDKQEAFTNIKKRITELSTDPNKLEDLVSRRTIHVSKIAPNISAHSIQTAIKGMQFLSTKLPNSTKNSPASSLFSKRESKPSEFEMSKFERYLEAVENPMSAIDDLQSGTLTREAAEAVKTVYPLLFQNMQQYITEKVAKDGADLQYSKRIQLGILLDLDTDSSLQPETIASLQSNLQLPPPEQSGGPTAARADKLNMSERQETKQNRLAQR